MAQKWTVPVAPCRARAVCVVPPGALSRGIRRPTALHPVGRARCTEEWPGFRSMVDTPRETRGIRLTKAQYARVRAGRRLGRKHTAGLFPGKCAPGSLCLPIQQSYRRAPRHAKKRRVGGTGVVERLMPPEKGAEDEGTLPITPLWPARSCDARSLLLRSSYVL